MKRQLDAKQLHAFVDPTMKVLEKLAKISCRVESARHEQLTLREETPAILIELMGDINGALIFQFDPSIMRQILVEMLGTADPIPTDPDSYDALCEFANIVAGNATGKLESMGFRTTISTPQVLNGGTGPDRLGGREGVKIPLTSQFGEIGICNFWEKT